MLTSSRGIVADDAGPIRQQMMKHAMLIILLMFMLLMMLIVLFRLHAEHADGVHNLLHHCVQGHQLVLAAEGLGILTTEIRVIKVDTEIICEMQNRSRTLITLTRYYPAAISMRLLLAAAPCSGDGGGHVTCGE